MRDQRRKQYSSRDDPWQYDSRRGKQRALWQRKRSHRRMKAVSTRSNRNLWTPRLLHRSDGARPTQHPHPTLVLQYRLTLKRKLCWSVPQRRLKGKGVKERGVRMDTCSTSPCRRRARTLALFRV
uniref:Uncharacterized protein n=1 Tax=Cacopsylla melanoneura TaxID=428564 RepID=A0A8D8YBG9_9HEMI